MCLSLVVLALFSALPSAVIGHGELIYPRARNLNADLIPTYTAYCPHCGNSGGNSIVHTRIVENNANFPAEYPDPQSEGTHGLCGDPFQNLAQANGFLAPIAEQPFMAAGSIQATWTEGDEVELRVGISTNHMGFFEFRICDEGIDLNTPDQVHGQACLDRNLLLRVDPATRPECESADISENPDCQPLDPAHPSRWYIPPNELARPADYGAPYHPYFVMRYKLPLGLVCSKCTMQWWYLTANSCHPTGEEDYYQVLRNYVGAWGDGVHDLSVCDNAHHTEQFWNCADIRINPRDGSYMPLPPPNQEVPEPPTDNGNDGDQPVSTPNPLPPTTPTDPSQCAAERWSECGGVHGCCLDPDDVCYNQNQYYSQCRPAGTCPENDPAWSCQVVPPPQAPPPPPSPPPPGAPRGCASAEPIAEYGNCTGQHSGCCGEGLVCYAQDLAFSQCRRPGTCPHCAWDCTPQPPPCDDPLPEHANCRSSRCCAAGLVCYEQDAGYAQCMPPGACPACDQWTCNLLLPNRPEVAPPPRSRRSASSGLALEHNSPVLAPGAIAADAEEQILFLVSFGVGLAGAGVVMAAGFEFGRRKERSSAYCARQDRLTSVAAET